MSLLQMSKIDGWNLQLKGEWMSALWKRTQCVPLICELYSEKVWSQWSCSLLSCVPNSCSLITDWFLRSMGTAFTLVRFPAMGGCDLTEEILAVSCLLMGVVSKLHPDNSSNAKAMFIFRMADDLHKLVTFSSQQERPFIMIGSKVGAMIARFYTQLYER